MGRGRPKKLPRVPAELDDEAEKALLYPVGAEVEVRSDDPGFVSSFYEATVAGHLISSGDRGVYTVVYSTLEGNDGEPLRETAAAADVRPRPPPTEDGAARRELAMYEMVEAFHNEGWWAGVVTAVPPLLPLLAGDRLPRTYKVTFPTSREQLEFEEAALRPHRVFEGGRWVPAAEVDKGSPSFNEGNQVEVSRSAKCFGESWNPATVFKVIGATNFLVQYRYVGDDGELVTEILDSQYIRPARTITRMDSKYRFSLSSHVEVFHEGSWWPGVILEVLGSGLNKKYVVKLKSHETDMDDVECVDVLTVENTQLRPRFDWDGKRWIRCSTEVHKKPANGPKLTSRKRSISAALALYNDGGETSGKPGSYLDKRLKNADVVSESIPPLLSVHSDNSEIKHKSSSYPEEMMKQRNAVLALGSQLALPSLPSMAGFGRLSDSSLAQSSHVEQSSSQMIIIPSVPQSRQLQASLFGAFGQPRPLPQGPLLGMQSLIPDFGSIEGSRKTLTDQEKQSTDEGYHLIGNVTQKNFNVGSFVGIGTALSSKREECVFFQTPEALGENPEIPMKGIAAKSTEEANNIVVISEDLFKPKHGHDDVELPNDVTAVCGMLSEINTVSCIDPRPQQDVEGSQERSGIDDLQQGGYNGDLGHDSTKGSIMIENLVISTTSTLGNPSDMNVYSFESSTQYGSKATKPDKCAISVEQDTGEEFCQRSLVMADNAKVHSSPSAKSCKATGHDDQLSKENRAAMVECMRSCVVPTENLSIMSPAILDGAVPNLLPSGGNFEVKNKEDMDKQNHQGNVLETQHASVDGPFSAKSLAALKGDIVFTESSTKNFSANEQHAVSQVGLCLALVECADESSPSIEKSAVTQLSSTGMSNSTETEPDNSLTIRKCVEDTAIAKYIASRTHDSCCPLLPESVAVHESVMNDRLSESLAIHHLPFVKTSPMWAQVEAMEIFSRVPQRPNFHQFQQHGPELREGMALGLMFSFANLAESINMLNVQDDKGLFEEKMKGISLLEANGFDVRDLRAHLETLLHTKNSRTELQDAMKKLEEKIAHKESDDCQLGTQIRMLTMAVHHLELHAYLLRNIRQSAISQKMNNAIEISTLRTEANDLERSYLSTVATR